MVETFCRQLPTWVQELEFEAVFMPYMLTNDGWPLIERIKEMGNLLPPPEEPKVISIQRG